MDRRCRVESEHLRAIAAEASRPIVITKARWRMYEEWLNYGEATSHSLLNCASFPTAIMTAPSCTWNA
jgi:hypothetical protein